MQFLKPNIKFQEIFEIFHYPPILVWRTKLFLTRLRQACTVEVN